MTHRFHASVDASRQVVAALCAADGFTEANASVPWTHVRLSSQYDCARLNRDASERAIFLALTKIVLAGAPVRLEDGIWVRRMEDEPRWLGHVLAIATEIHEWLDTGGLSDRS